MSVMPPPIPSRKSTDTAGTAFASLAAKCAVIAPALLFTLTLLIEPLLQSKQGPEVMLIAYLCAGVSCLILVGGLVLGISALVLALLRPGERIPSGIIAGLGLALTGLFLAIFIPNFVRGREKAMAQRKDLEEVRAATKQLQTEGIKAFTEGRQADVSALKKSVDKAAAESTGDSAAYMRVFSADLQRVQTLQVAYNDAVQQLTNTHVLQTSNIVGREQLKTRKAVVQKFLDANEALETFINSHEQILHDELVREHLSEKDVAVALGAFRKKAGAQRPLLLEVRKTDRRTGNAMMAALDLLDADWGQWHYNASKAKIIFQDTVTLQKFNAAIQEINSAVADQKVAQQKLQAVMAEQLSMR